jgi:putative ABC transport system permease protein
MNTSRDDPSLAPRARGVIGTIGTIGTMGAIGTIGAIASPGGRGVRGIRGVLAVLAVLAVGFAALAAAVALTSAVLVSPLPYRDPGRLVMMEGIFTDHGQVQTWPISTSDFADWRQGNTVFAEMSLFGTNAYNLERGRQSRRLSGELVNAGYFSLLGLRPAAGRFFTPAEDARPFERYVVVLGHDLWRASFGADPRVVGRQVALNGRPYQVVGVAPPGFRGLSDQADLWVPSMVPPTRDYVTARRFRWASGAARLAPGVTVARAQAQLNTITAALARRFPDMNHGMGVRLTPLATFWFGSLRRPLLALTAAAAGLLLLACLDAVLLLARAAARRRPAGPATVAATLALPSLPVLPAAGAAALGLLAAGLGLLLARWATPRLAAASGVGLPSFVQPGGDLATAGLVLALGLLCGLACARAASRLGAAGARRLGGALVAAQVVLALLLAARTGVAAHGFRALIGEDLGFRPDRLLTFRIDLEGPQYLADPPITRLVAEQYLPRIAALPGVSQVAITNPTLPTDNWSGGYVSAEDHRSTASDGTWVAMLHAVTPGYFALLRIPILSGREFVPADRQAATVVVSKAMAELLWPGKDPRGRRLKLGEQDSRGNPWLTVVGVAADARYEGPTGDKPPAPDVYLSLLRFPLRLPMTINFLVRPRPAMAAAELRQRLHRELAAIAPELPEYDLVMLSERVARQADKARFQLILAAIATGFVLLLAAAGAVGARAARAAGAAGAAGVAGARSARESRHRGGAETKLAVEVETASPREG